MTSNFTFIYDGECPFCDKFAELLEIKSKINNIEILDGRKNLTIIKSLLEKMDIWALINIMMRTLVAIEFILSMETLIKTI